MNNIQWNNKTVMIVGGDQQALEMARKLKGQGAIVKVVNPWFVQGFSRLGVTLDQTYDTAGAMEGADFVLCLSDAPSVNKSTADDAIHRGIPVYCLDDPERTTLKGNL